MRKLLVGVLLAVGGFSPRSASSQTEPVVRIGLDQNGATVTLRSASSFRIQQHSTRSARFTAVLSLNPSAANRILKREDLRYRMVVELDNGGLVVLPMSTKIRINAPAMPVEFDGKSYRGSFEVFGNSRNTFTVVNQLPLEEYLLGVVPNELSPTAFGELAALKAQAVAARTYIVRNMGQYKNENYDICATDACQVYFGAGTEQQLFTLRDGDGLLLTTVKWASGNGKPFLGEDHAHSGISPSVEVKRPELADAVSPDDLTGNEEDATSKPNQPSEKRDVAPESPKPVEDIQMKKALELLRDNKPAPGQRAM